MGVRIHASAARKRLLQLIGPLRRRFVYLLLCSAILSILPWTLWTHPLVQKLSDLAMVSLVGYGVWEVFARIRMVEDAARAGDERALAAHATAPDELGRLAGALAENLRVLDERNQADRDRVTQLRFHEAQIQKLAAELNAWVAGSGELDIALSRLSVSQEPVYSDIAQQMLTNACIARRLIEVQEVRGRMWALLSRMAGLDDGLRELGEHLRRLLPHDRAYLSTESACYAIDPHGVTSIEAAPALDDDHTVRVPLCVHSRRVGELLLERVGGAFTPAESVALAPVAPVLASALARMALESRLRSADRMAIVGAMGRVMAHQLRNPINNLVLQMALLERRCGGDQIHALKAECDRLARLVDGFLRLAKDGDEPLEKIDLRALVEAAVARHKPLLSDLDIGVEIDAGANPAEILGDTANIEQLIDQLIDNAAHAMAEAPRRRLSIHLGPQNGSWELRVRDTGPGLADPEAIFRPSRQKAGLALGQHIARLHRGDLRAANHPEGGAELILTLARSDNVLH